MGRLTNLKDQYFSWLYKQIGRGNRSYRILCVELHSKPFRWHVHNDDNRCEDGLALRQTFMDEEHIDQRHLEVDYFLRRDCSVLEVLVALAQRIEFQTEDPGVFRKPAGDWFLEMIKNLGLDIYTDGHNHGNRFSELDETRIDEILEKFMDRMYDYYGNGGLFPLKRKPPQDQTRVEIWYQLMLYLDENYSH